MKTLFIDLISTQEISAEEIRKLVNKLPSRLFLAYTIQYRQIAEKIRKLCKKKIIGFRQILGCSKIKTKNILFIGDGEFHLQGIDAENIYTYDGSLKKIPKETIDNLKKFRTRAIAKFYSADKVGILVSCKPGQENFKQALSLRDKLKKQNKEAFIFLSDNISQSDLDNFQVESWINTACPGLVFDFPVVNLSDITI